MRRLALAAAVALGALVLTGCGTINTLITGEDDVFTLAVGDCFDADSQIDGPTEIETVPTVDCAEPHDYEVYSAVIMDDDEYPGEEQTIAEADEQCTSLFEGFIGVPYDEALAYAVSYFYPTSPSWNLGDREILCLVYGIDETGVLEKVTGTLRDAEA